MKIWCPGCEWKPRPSDKWWCIPRDGGCSHVWNTFDTGGVCPKCTHIWKMTACLSCHCSYPHVDWYHDDVETSVEETAQIDLNIEAPTSVPS